MRIVLLFEAITITKTFKMLFNIILSLWNEFEMMVYIWAQIMSPFECCAIFLLASKTAFNVTDNSHVIHSFHCFKE
jgi:hypothetical protein